MRWFPLSLVALLSLVAVPWAGSVRTGSGNRQWIDPTGASAIALQAVESRFGRQDGFIVALFADDVLADGQIAWQRLAIDAIRRLPGVLGVDGLPNAQEVEFDDLGPAPVPLLARQRAEILNHPLYRGLLVAADGRAAALVVRLDPIDDHATVALEARLRGWLADHPPGSGHAVLGGLPVQQQALNRAVAADQAVTVPATVLTLAVLLLVILRDWRPALVILLGIGSALAWTFAGLAWAGRELDALLGLLPPLVLGIGTTTGLHLSWAIGDALDAASEAARHPGREALRRTFAPLSLATLTTMAGVGGLWWAAMPAVQGFAPWAVLGVGLAALLPACWLLAVVRLIPTHAWQARRNGPCGPRLGDGLGRIASWCARRRAIVIGLAVVVLSAAGWSCLRLRPDADFLHALPADDPAQLAHAAIDDRLTGVLGLDLLIDPGHPTTAADLAGLRTIAEAARREPTITACLSLAEVDALLAARGDDRPTEERLADLALGAKAVLARFRSGTVLRLHARQRDGSVAEAAAAARRIASAASAAMPGSHLVIASGALLLDETTTSLLPSVARGLTASLLMNGVLLLVFLRRWRLALIGLLLSAVPLVVTYAGVPLLGWPLDVGVSMIACVALGIIMDDAIHMAYALHRHGDAASAARAIGPVLTAACLALASAFATCALGGFAYTRRFGILLAIAFLTGLVVNLLLAPALLRRRSLPSEIP